MLAGDVGTSKSFHGPVGLVSPYSLRGLQQTKGLAAALDATLRAAQEAKLSAVVGTALARETQSEPPHLPTGLKRTGR